MRAITSYYPFLFLSFAFASFDLSRQYELHIVPTKTHSCPTMPCRTLEEFADNLSSYNHANITLFFVGGNHRLGKTISISNITSLSMISTINDNERPKIFCSEFAKFIFSDIQSVYICGLMFNGCISNEIVLVSNLTIKHCTLLGRENMSVDLPERTEMADIPNFFLITKENYRNYFDLLPIAMKL